MNILFWLSNLHFCQYLSAVTDPLIDPPPIQLLESPIPAATSQKASTGDISGTKRGIKAQMVSKQAEKNSKENQTN